MMSFVRCLLFALLGGSLSPAVASVDDHFSAIRTDPNALYSFFKEMPKGGELHYHLDGGAYPEAMLALAAQGDYCIDLRTNTIEKPAKPCNGVTATTLLTKPELYNQIIRAWSMKDFITGRESAHDHFFASFSKSLPLRADYRPQLLAEVMKRATNQHELYLEIMILPDNADSATFGELARGPIGFSAKKRALLANKNFQANITKTVSESKHILEQARHELGCDALPDEPICSLTVKFQYYVLREQPIDNLFAQALNGFAAAALSNDIVGINIVQAEDGIISLRDYREQMRIFKFLHASYPGVHISLHAGELAPKSVLPAELNTHIHDAIYIGRAERIGHGVSIAYENGAEHLLNYMAKTPIPVEINLTSNREILQVAGKSHPLNYYLAHHVPVVFSTDDEGVLRTDLSREYVEAVINQGLDYKTIKAINQNALTYSFLPGKSLWSNPSKHIPVSECQQMGSFTCQQFIKENQKAKLQWELEKNLDAFELGYDSH